MRNYLTLNILTAFFILSCATENTVIDNPSPTIENKETSSGNPDYVNANGEVHIEYDRYALDYNEKGRGPLVLSFFRNVGGITHFMDFKSDGDDFLIAGYYTGSTAFNENSELSESTEQPIIFLARFNSEMTLKDIKYFSEIDIWYDRPRFVTDIDHISIIDEDEIFLSFAIKDNIIAGDHFEPIILGNDKLHGRGLFRLNLTTHEYSLARFFGDSGDGRHIDINDSILLENGDILFAARVPMKAAFLSADGEMDRFSLTGYHSGVIGCVSPEGIFKWFIPIRNAPAQQITDIGDNKYIVSGSIHKKMDTSLPGEAANWVHLENISHRGGYSIVISDTGEILSPIQVFEGDLFRGSVKGENGEVLVTFNDKIILGDIKDNVFHKQQELSLSLGNQVVNFDEAYWSYSRLAEKTDFGDVPQNWIMNRLSQYALKDVDGSGNIIMMPVVTKYSYEFEPMGTFIMPYVRSYPWTGMPIETDEALFFYDSSPPRIGNPEYENTTLLMIPKDADIKSKPIVRFNFLPDTDKYGPGIQY